MIQELTGPLLSEYLFADWDSSPLFSFSLRQQLRCLETLIFVSGF